jgi:hypothetical protein
MQPYLRFYGVHIKCHLNLVLMFTQQEKGPPFHHLQKGGSTLTLEVIYQKIWWCMENKKIWMWGISH